MVSGFRFGVFGRALLLIGPVRLIATIVMNVAMPAQQTYRPIADLVAILATTLLLTPLQAAGEEYGVRASRGAHAASRPPSSSMRCSTRSPSSSSPPCTAEHGWI
ncbi:hypothetical protein [Marinactinospora rubrisoli]|uniref:Uncharacterized protein n=1 Tax=Marinactinospora rubrisoli TaxID=2715399 RepID=A0ABW2K939_9ACTN